MTPNLDHLGRNLCGAGGRSLGNDQRGVYFFIGHYRFRLCAERKLRGFIHLRSGYTCPQAEYPHFRLERFVRNSRRKNNTCQGFDVEPDDGCTGVEVFPQDGRRSPNRPRMV